MLAPHSNVTVAVDLDLNLFDFLCKAHVCMSSLYLIVYT